LQRSRRAFVSGKHLQRLAERIFLCGAPGCGKTTVGRLLARSLKRPFVDIDAVIVKREGRPIAQIFAESGESAFRAIESTVLADVVEMPHAVVALGGGTLLAAENRALIARSGRTVYLRASVPTLEARLTRGGAVRPLLARTPVGTLLDERRLLYEDAHAIVDVDGLDPRTVVTAIEAVL
jgi:shikimate kinase